MSREQNQEPFSEVQAAVQKHCPHLLEMRGLQRAPDSRRGCAGREYSRRTRPCRRRRLYRIRRKATRDSHRAEQRYHRRIPPFAYVLHLKPAGKPEVMMWTYGGMIGYHGINSAGIGEFANALGGGPPGRFAMPHYPVKRLMLECKSLAEVVDLLEEGPARLQRQLCSLRCGGHSRYRGDYGRARGTEERRQGLSHPYESLRLFPLCEKREFRAELERLLFRAWTG